MENKPKKQKSATKSLKSKSAEVGKKKSKKKIRSKTDTKKSGKSKTHLKNKKTDSQLALDVDEDGSTVPLKKSRSSKRSTKASRNLSIDEFEIIDEKKHIKIVKFCAELAAEIYQEAEDIFSNRFCHGQKDIVMLGNLRDTWLRVIECQFMDFNSQHCPSTVLAKSMDTPALPIGHDFWARGALELYPESRRESVLDPFIRHNVLGRTMSMGGRSYSIKSIPSLDASFDEEEETMISKSKKRQKKSKKSKKKSKKLKKTKSKSKSKKKTKSKKKKTTKSKKKKTTMKKKTAKSKKKKLKKKKQIKNEGEEKGEWDESEEDEEEMEHEETSDLSLLGGGDAIVSDQDFLSSLLSESEIEGSTKDKEILIIKRASESLVSKKSSTGIKPWTISNNAGVFKLFRQTTSEAIRQKSMDENKSKELKIENQITDDGQDGQKLSLDDPGTESIYEHDALNASLPQSQVTSQSNLILAKDEENELISDGEEEDLEDNSDATIDADEEKIQTAPAQRTAASMDFLKEQIQIEKIRKDQAIKRDTMINKRKAKSKKKLLTQVKDDTT